VAVTGVGAISPIGNDAVEALDTAIAGRSAIRRLSGPGTERLGTPLAACVNIDAAGYFEAPRLRMLDRVTQFALLAARQSLQQADLRMGDEQRTRAGVFIGSGLGGAHTTDEGYRILYEQQSERLKPFTVLMSMGNASAAWLSMEVGLTGPALTYCTACSSSAVAVGEAWRRIRHGELDIALAGGAEAPLCLGVMKAWEALHVLASIDPADPAASCKPFSKNRSGLVLAEGAAMLVLEEWEQAQGRGARILGELIGYGLATDVNHITRPSIAGQAAAMREALRSAGCAPQDIDCINAHGTGTPANDHVETAAIKEVFGEHARHLPISATKSVHGHLLGASAALELVLSLLAMRRGVLLPTMHLQQPDEQCDLDYVANCARLDANVQSVMSNAFAFGGTNAVLVARTVR
jgi:3-oxoacyl-[acyl-carrier-protein] synthase II